MPVTLVDYRLAQNCVSIAHPLIFDMRLSVIIPAYNEESYIGRCLDAVLAADLPAHTEILVVNNASQDKTGDIVRHYTTVRLVDEPQKGLTKARQRGFLSSSGDVLYYIDADTLIPKHLLSYVLSRFERNPRLAAVSGPYKYHDWHAFGRWILWTYHWTAVPLTQLVINRLFKKGSVFYGGNFALRRTALENIGGFDTALEFWSEDTQIGRRLGTQGQVRFFHRAYVFTSARRYYAEGLFRVLFRYIFNFFWDIIFHRPFTKGYRDVRDHGSRPNPSELPGS